MITSRADLARYQRADRHALGTPHGLKSWLLDDIWRYQRTLRQLEFRLNVPGNPVLLVLSKLRYRRLGRQLGISIPPNVFGPGLSIAHPGTIVVHAAVRVGANCRIHAGVSIGTSRHEPAAVPTIGDDCYLGPGAKLFGAIELGPRTIVGANAVVDRSFPTGHVTVVGIPARPVGGES